MQDRARGHRGLPSAARALPCRPPALQRPPRSVAAAGTDEAVGPAPLDEVTGTRLLVGEARLEVLARHEPVGLSAGRHDKNIAQTLRRSKPTQHKMWGGRRQGDKPCWRVSRKLPYWKQRTKMAHTRFADTARRSLSVLRPPTKAATKDHRTWLRTLPRTLSGGQALDAEDIAKSVAEQLRKTLRTDVDERYLTSMVRARLFSNAFIDDLAELYRAAPDELRASLGIQSSTATSRTTTISDSEFNEKRVALGQAVSLEFLIPESVSSSDRFSTAAAKARSEINSFQSSDKLTSGFLDYYRIGVKKYFSSFESNVAPKIMRFIQESDLSNFRYLVTAGIGANEQFWHSTSEIYNNSVGYQRWIVSNSSKDLTTFPDDMTCENTLFLGFSRSGKTQETVKFFEFLDPSASVILFANSGPLQAIGHTKFKNSLMLEFPDDIPGRFGKNKTPLIPAPFLALGLNYSDYFEFVDDCIRSWDLADPESPPVKVAEFIRISQLHSKVDHMYIGINDPVMRSSGAEFVQFWNEGVAKDGNNLTVSHYLGLPRDSHFNVEGILANADTKMSMFIVARTSPVVKHSIMDSEISPVNQDHRGLSVHDVDWILARANADHFGTKMPTIVLDIEQVDYEATAVLSQLWADVCFVYTSLLGINPGSNPEVRHVRDRSEFLLSQYSPPEN